MKISGLLYKNDISEIGSIEFMRPEGLKDKELLLDNIRLVESPERDPNFLKGIADKFGQNAKIDFPIKVYSEEEKGSRQQIKRPLNH